MSLNVNRVLFFYEFFLAEPQRRQLLRHHHARPTPSRVEVHQNLYMCIYTAIISSPPLLGDNMDVHTLTNSHTHIHTHTEFFTQMYFTKMPVIVHMHACTHTHTHPNFDKNICVCAFASLFVCMLLQA